MMVLLMLVFSRLADGKVEQSRHVALPTSLLGAEARLDIYPARSSRVFLYFEHWCDPSQETQALGQALRFAKEHGISVVRLVIDKPKTVSGELPFDFDGVKSAHVRQLLQMIDRSLVGQAELLLLIEQPWIKLGEAILSSTPNRIRSWVSLGTPHSSWKSAAEGLVIWSLQPQGAAFERAWTDYQAQRSNNDKRAWLVPKSVAVGRSFMWHYFAETLTASNRPVGVDPVTHEVVQSVELLANPERYLYLPSGKLLDLWSSAAAAKQTPTRPIEIVQRRAATRVDGQSEIAFVLRLPEQRPVNGVLAFCTWETSQERLDGQVRNPGHRLVQFADKHNLALLTWTTATLWQTGRSHQDLQTYDANRMSREFDLVAHAWDRAVNAMSREYELPPQDWLLYGFSRGAHWSHRLALRKPERFLAVHIHVANSYDRPTTGGRELLWLVTTGGRDRGFRSALRFYQECRAQDYGILLRSTPSLGHSENRESNRIGLAFFEYAMKKKAEREIQRTQRGTRLTARDLRVWNDQFLEPAFIADVHSQLVFSAERGGFLPENQQVRLPSEELARAWGPVLE